MRAPRPKSYPPEIIFLIGDRGEILFGVMDYMLICLLVVEFY